MSLAAASLGVALIGGIARSSRIALANSSAHHRMCISAYRSLVASLSAARPQRSSLENGVSAWLARS